jgi:protein involved in polysaccharide export with SLBB domain
VQIEKVVENKKMNKIQKNKRFAKGLLAVLIFVISNVVSFSQSLSDIQNIKVDDLSDAQIEQLIKRAETSGLTEMQLEMMAKERGLPASEIAKLRARINKIRSGGSSAAASSQPSSADESQLRGLNFEPEEQEIQELSLTEEEKQIFGFSVFRNTQLSFSPNLNIPTPKNYVLGAGDQLMIDIYGASQFLYDVTINSDGLIFIPAVGPINISGLTVDAATNRISSALSNIYSGLKGSNPNTFMSLRVGNIRSIQVSMVGEVFAPGTYTLTSFATVFNALYAAGGITKDGSFREIRVYRNSKLVSEVDVYQFLVNGDQKSNIRLEEGDVILIPPVQKRVEVSGPLRRPGFFEVKEDESLEDLIKFAGGFSSKAYPNIGTVLRTTDSELKVENIDKAGFSSFNPKDGDSFIFGELLDRYENRVQVSGALMRPGVFALEPGMGINDLIKRAEGLREDAFMNRATLYRTRPDFSLEIVTVNIGAIIRGEVPDISLQREDVLNVPSIYDLREEYYVLISGEVNRPGAFAFGENMKVGDLVLRAGGFKESATASQIEIARRVKDDVSGKLAEIFHIDISRDLKITGENADMILKPFDHVIIRRSPGFQRERLVSVEGEVFYPGEYAISNASERVSDLLKRAGGMNQFAYPKGASLIRRNEFFNASSDNQIKSQNLIQVKQNSLMRTGRNTEAEKYLLDRIDEKIAERGGDLSNREGGLLINNFRRDAIKELVGDSVDVDEVSGKTIEMIGIDLEEIIRNPGGVHDLFIQEGDVLSIPKLLQTVRMRGEVLFPTSARFDQSLGFKGYISRSGGFTENARKKRSFVVYANGDVRKTTNLLLFKVYPKIEPGSEIIVPRKPEKNSMPLQAWIAIATSVATLALVVNNFIQ